MTGLEPQSAPSADPEPRRSLVLEVMIEDEGWSDFPALADDITRAGEALAERLGISAAEVAVALSSDLRVRALNGAYRGKDKPTNVLSFPSHADPDARAQPRFLGDIILARETVAREAEGEGKPLTHHVQHLVVHGLLHLLGYDHEFDTEASEMEQLEIQILKGLGIPNPYEGA